MTDFNRTESAKWALENQKLVGDLHTGADKVLTEAAGRGFAAAPGVTLATILAAGQEVKDKLTEANGKIYDDRRKVLFEQDEFAMKIIVQLAKLGMELYREELMNALAIEQAENTALRDQGLADVTRMNAEVDARQVAIIQARAEAERRVVALKAQLVIAEEGTLVYEEALIRAQLATAIRKLDIIASIYEVLAAEELVLAAENRRAATLEILLAAQMVVAEIKKAMVPFYIEKADARLALANATIAEMEFTEAIVRLGYDRIALEDAKESAAHEMRVAEEEVELARAAWTRANKLTEYTRAHSRTLLQLYANEIQTELLARKAGLSQDNIQFHLDSALSRQAIGINNDVAVSGHEVVNIGSELASILNNLNLRARDEYRKIRASAFQNNRSDTTHMLGRKIVEGMIVGFTNPDEGAGMSGMEEW